MLVWYLKRVSYILVRWFVSVIVLCSASRLSRSEPFAIAHVKLMKDDDTTIEDGTHELFVYKVRHTYT